MDPALDSHLDQTITLSGTARDAVMGAVVVTSTRTPVYIDGLEEWDDATFGANISVTGILRKKSLGPDPQVAADGGVSHGIEGSQYVLESAQWSASAT